MHPEDIKSELRKQKLNSAKLARIAGISASSIKEAFRRPQPTAEQVIANALNLKPFELWPDRYFQDGTRKTISVERHQVSERGKACHRLNEACK